MSSDPRIAPRVKELVWDVTIEPGYQHRGPNEPLEGRPGCRARVHRIMAEYSMNRTHGHDFKLLLAALPHLSNLRAVVFAELMNDWTEPHNAFKLDGQYRTRRYSPQAEQSTYESPAMREWFGLELGALYAPGTYGNPRPSLGSLARIERWAQSPESVFTQSHSLVDHIAQFRTKTYREIVLLLVAVHVRNLTLESFSVEAAPEPSLHFYGGMDAAWFWGIDIAAIDHFTQGLTRLMDAFRPLRRLCLCLDNLLPRNSPRNWRVFIPRLLNAAENLETLELRLYERDDLPVIQMPHFPQLRTMVLGNFNILHDRLELFLLRWGYSIRLKTLILVDCVILAEEPMGEKDVLKRLRALGKEELVPRESMHKDIRLLSVDPEPPEEGTTSEVGHPPSRVPFMDIGFKSQDGSDSDYMPASSEQSEEDPEKDDALSLLSDRALRSLKVFIDPKVHRPHDSVTYPEDYRLCLWVDDFVVDVLPND
ncbi:uncharacterized protein BDV17DRAFT_286910 [Aspergillus undulatus]|uniref:uncharacterized protein n=1 Tax=Aspergillus undulatus TaxID=1810928 RepID=UPI003CCDB288